MVTDFAKFYELLFLTPERVNLPGLCEYSCYLLFINSFEHSTINHSAINYGINYA